MIRIEEIILHNWGPFYLDNKITVGDTNQIFLYGNPQVGKTKIRHALHYLLFNKLEKTNETSNLASMLCEKAICDSSDHSFFVEVTCADDDGSTYKIRKTFKPLTKDFTELKESNKVQEETSFSKNGENPKYDTNAIKEISRLFPSSLHRFFLMHSDMVKERYSNPDVVKKDLEALLGLNKLDIAKKVLNSLLGEYNAKLLRLGKGNMHSELSQDFQIAEQDMEKYRNYISEKEEELRNKKESLKKDINLLEDQEDLKEAFQNEEKYKDNRKKLRKNKDDEWSSLNNDADFSFIDNFIHDKLIKNYRSSSSSQYFQNDIELIQTLASCFSTDSFIVNNLNEDQTNLLIQILEKNPKALKEKSYSDHDHYRKYTKTQIIEDKLKKILKINGDLETIAISLQNANDIIQEKSASMREDVKNAAYRKPILEKEIEEQIPEMIDNYKKELEDAKQKRDEIKEKLDRLEANKENENEQNADKCRNYGLFFEMTKDDFVEEYRPIFSEKLNKIHDKFLQNYNKELKLNIDENFIVSFKTKATDVDRTEASESQAYMAAIALTKTISDEMSESLPLYFDNPFDVGDNETGQNIIKNIMVGSKQQVFIASQTDTFEFFDERTLKEQFPKAKHFKIERLDGEVTTITAI